MIAIPSASQTVLEIQYHLSSHPGYLRIRTDQPIFTPQGPSFVYHNATKILSYSPEEITVGSDEGDWIKGSPSAVLHALLQRASPPTPPLTGDNIFHATRASLTTK